MKCESEASRSGTWCCVCCKIFFFTLFSEQFDETNIKSILETVVALLEIDVPESKAKVLMLIAEIAKSGKDRTLDSLSCSLSW